MPLNTELVNTISYIKSRTQEFQNRIRSISRRLISLILSLSDITVTVVVTRVVDGVCMSFTDHFVLGVGLSFSWVSISVSFSFVFISTVNIQKAE